MKTTLKMSRKGFMDSSAEKQLENLSLEETLTKAEQDHYRLLPNADLLLRACSFILDVIFSYIAVTALQKLCDALNTHFSHIDLMNLSNSFYASWLSYLSENSGTVSANLLLLLKIAFFYFYFVWSSVFAGGSAGKLLMGIRVLDEKTGKNLSLPQALIRQVIGLNLCILSLGIGFSFSFFRPDKRALHDLIAGTVVKKVHGVR